MKNSTVIAVLLALVAALVVCSSGCSDDTVKPAGDDKSPYRDLTDKEGCIENLLISYRLMDIDGYADILHRDYIWYGKKWGMFGDDLDTLDRERDIALTEQIFNDAFMLDLEIDPGTWEEIEKIGEDPCPECWQTDRSYHIQAQLIGDETIYTWLGRVMFVVAPGDNDGTTEYRIRMGYEIDDY